MKLRPLLLLLPLVWPVLTCANGFDSTMSYQLRDSRSVAVRNKSFPSVQVETWLSVRVRIFSIVGEPAVSCVGTWRVSDEPAGGRKPTVKLIAAQLAFPVSLAGASSGAVVPCDIGAPGKGDGVDPSLTVAGSPSWERFLMRWNPAWPAQGMPQPFWWESQASFLSGKQLKELARISAITLDGGPAQVLHLSFDVSGWEAELAEQELDKAEASRQQSGDAEDARLEAAIDSAKRARRLAQVRAELKAQLDAEQALRRLLDAPGMAEACRRAVASQGQAQLNLACRKADLEAMREKGRAVEQARRERHAALEQARLRADAPPPPPPKPAVPPQPAPVPAPPPAPVAAPVQAAPAPALAPAPAGPARSLQSAGRRWSHPVPDPKYPTLYAMNYQSAKQACANLVLDGVRGWRLPGIDELKALYESRELQPLLGTWKLNGQYVWSSTPNTEVKQANHLGYGSPQIMNLDPSHPGLRFSFRPEGMELMAICVNP